MRERLEALRSEKTSQSAASLATIWKIGEDGALSWARELVEVGFFEERGSKDDPEFWVPFMYRDALDMVQGSAD